jgi:uncharacterized protein (TIGR00288 family)
MNRLKINNFRSIYKNIRVYIDCDNVSTKYYPIIYNELKSLNGNIQKVSLYGDWTRSESQSWLNISKENGYESILALKYNKLKESSDIRMAVDILNTYYNGINIDTYCIISNDTDFIHIINMLKEKDSKVIGFGLSTGNIVLKNTYTKFISLDKSEFIDSYVYFKTLRIIDKKIKSEGYIDSNYLYKYLLEINPYFNYKLYGYSKFITFLRNIYGNIYEICIIRGKVIIK